jgi:hypothetical protein
VQACCWCLLLWATAAAVAQAVPEVGRLAAAATPCCSCKYYDHISLRNWLDQQQHQSLTYAAAAAAAAAAACRNITVRGPAGSFPVLDLQWKRGKLLLCSACVFTFSNMVVANERQGVGPALDIFIGRPGSSVKLQDVYRCVFYWALHLPCSLEGWL